MAHHQIEFNIREKSRQKQHCGRKCTEDALGAVHNVRYARGGGGPRRCDSL